MGEIKVMLWVLWHMAHAATPSELAVITLVSIAPVATFMVAWGLVKYGKED